MNNEQFVAKTIAEQSQMTPNRVVESFDHTDVGRFESDEDVARPVFAARS